MTEINVQLNTTYYCTSLLFILINYFSTLSRVLCKLSLIVSLNKFVRLKNEISYFSYSPGSANFNFNQVARQRNTMNFLAQTEVYIDIESRLLQSISRSGAPGWYQFIPICILQNKISFDISSNNSQSTTVFGTFSSSSANTYDAFATHISAPVINVTFLVIYVDTPAIIVAYPVSYSTSSTVVAAADIRAYY